jgi:hypothetical protein
MPPEAPVTIATLLLVLGMEFPLVWPPVIVGLMRRNYSFARAR